MKKLLSLAFLLVCTLTMIQAQSTEVKKACCKKGEKTCAAKKTAATTEASMTKVASAYMEADKIAEADESIEKRVCAQSGKTSYYKKSVCEKSGSVSWNEVEFDNDAKAFNVVMADGSAMADETKVGSASKEKACCSKGSKEKCASKDKACCKKGDKKECSKDKASCAKTAKTEGSK